MIYNKWDKGVNQMKMRKIMLSLTVILMIAMLVACNEDEETEKEEKETVTPVEVADITEGDLVIEKSFYGRAEPNKTTPIMIQMPGEVDSLEVEEGDEVKEDDIVAKLKTPAGTQNVRASKDGTIVNLDVSEGEMVSDEEPFALIADLDKMKVLFEVTSTDHSLFSKEDKRKLLLDGEKYEAEITQVGSMPGETGLFSVKAKVNNEDATILPGTVMKLNVPTKRVKDSLLVPTEAIVEEDDESFIYLVKDDKVTKTKVTIKESQTDQTAIEADAKEGNQVVIKGQLTLSDGSQVNVVEAGE